MTEYQLVTHCAPAMSGFSSLMIVGMDTPTMVPSRTIRASPTASAASAAHGSSVS